MKKRSGRACVNNCCSSRISITLLKEGYQVGYTTVCNYIRSKVKPSREVFIRQHYEPWNCNNLLEEFSGSYSFQAPAMVLQEFFQSHSHKLYRLESRGSPVVQCHLVATKPYSNCTALLGTYFFVILIVAAFSTIRVFIFYTWAP